jgi:hypothetical protein
MMRPELRFVPPLGAPSIEPVAVGYLLAGDTPGHLAAGLEIRDDDARCDTPRHGAVGQRTTLPVKRERAAHRTSTASRS